jgi:hypothetical protein
MHSADIIDASSRSLGWLQRAEAVQPQDRCLVALALAYCGAIMDGVLPWGDVATLASDPPPVPELIVLPTAQLRRLLQGERTLGPGDADRETADTFAHLALYFARGGDIITFSDIVPVACALGCSGSLAIVFLRYLLDQQRDDGAFGLYNVELKALADAQLREPEIRLKVTARAVRAMAFAWAHAIAVSSAHLGSERQHGMPVPRSCI